jgi:hypothetical protein
MELDGVDKREDASEHKPKEGGGKQEEEGKTRTGIHGTDIGGEILSERGWGGHGKVSVLGSH